MTKGNDTLLFTYDATGTPLAVKFNNTTYYYKTNLQGDILGILDGSGTEVVSYAYDAWGVLLACTGSMADTLGTLNPLRYRGYVYDPETALYYLQSRYYNPAWGRFINADGLVTTGQGFVGNNMFAYCLNNPICMKDIYGEYPVYYIYGVETKLIKEDENGKCYYETTITYITGDSNDPYFVLYAPKQVAKFTYTVSGEGIIAFDNNQTSSYLIPVSQICNLLASEMMSVAKKQVPGSLNGRTKSGMVFEMQSHYYGNILGIKLNNTKVTHMGSNIKGSKGYSENDDWFEHPARNIPKILQALFKRRR